MRRPPALASAVVALLAAAAGCDQDAGEKRQLREQITAFNTQRAGLAAQQATAQAARDQYVAGRPFAALSAAEQAEVHRLNAQLVAAQQQVATLDSAITTSQNRLYELEHGNPPPGAVSR